MRNSDEPGALRTAIRTCHLCEVSCGLRIELTADDEVVSVRGDRDDVYSAGYLCAKGAAIGAIHHDPDRLRRPMVRNPAGYLVETTWDHAFERVDDLLRPLLDVNRSTVALFTGNPSGHNMAGTLLQAELQRALASSAVYSVATVDQMPQVLTAGLMYGTPTSIPIADVDRTDLMIVIGANPFVSNGSLGAGPAYPQRLRRLRERGGALVVVDPVATPTARTADLHVAIEPGTDALLLLSVVREIFNRGAVRLAAATGLVDGLELVERTVRHFAPAPVEVRCGVPTGTVDRLTDLLLGADRAAVYGRTGISLTAHATVTSWAIQLLNILSGNLDRAGGVMFSTPAVGSRTTLPRPRPSAPIAPGSGRSPGRGAPDVLGEFPAAGLADDILVDHPDRVRGLITFAGNVARSLPGSTDVTRALRSLDAMVCIDPYVNETTRHADVILPPPSPLTRPHYDIALYAYGIRNIANYSPATLPAGDGELAEWDILLRLIATLTGEDRVAGGVAAGAALAERRLRNEMAERIERQHGIPADEALESTTDRGAEGLLDMRLRTGPYGDHYGRSPDGLTLAALRARPHGIDFGPLVPRLDAVLSASPTGRIDLVPPAIVDDVVRAEALLDGPRPSGLTLLGRRGRFSMNSFLHNIDGLAGRDRCTLRLSPEDAAERCIEHGDRVEVTSRRARLVVTAEVDEGMRPGVCSLPHGHGHGSSDVILGRAALLDGVNANALTDPELLDQPTGTAALYGTIVEVAAVDDPNDRPGRTATTPTDRMTT